MNVEYGVPAVVFGSSHLYWVAVSVWFHTVRPVKRLARELGYEDELYWWDREPDASPAAPNRVDSSLNKLGSM